MERSVFRLGGGAAPGMKMLPGERYVMDGLSYRVMLKPHRDDGGLNVAIPAFPLPHVQGDNVVDALRNAHERDAGGPLSFAHSSVPAA